MEYSKVIKITNPNNESVYVINDAELGELLIYEGGINIKRSTQISEKVRNGKQVSEYMVKFSNNIDK